MENARRVFHPILINVARRKLRMLDAAFDVRDLTQPPGNAWKNFGAIAQGGGPFASTINGGYVSFGKRMGAYEVEVVDYH